MARITLKEQVIVADVDTQWQADLVDTQWFSIYDNAVKRILTVTDILVEHA